MRKFFSSKTDTHRIDLGDGQWIDILAVCSHGIKQKATTAMMKPSMSGSSEKDVHVTANFNAGAFNDTLLNEMIVDWSFLDEKGNPIPVTRENINNLAADITSLVVAEINKLNPTRKDPEKNS